MDYLILTFLFSTTLVALRLKIFKGFGFCRCLITVSFLLVAFTSCKQKAAHEIPSKEISTATHYLGQIAPGDTAEVFAPGLIALPDVIEFTCSFSPKMDHMIFGHNHKEQGLYLMETKLEEDGKWSSPKKISFTGFEEGEAIFSPDGSKIFFSVHSDSTKNKIHDIWFVEAQGDTWSAPTKLNDSINSSDYEYFGTLTHDNQLYFSREGSIMQATYKNGDFGQIKMVDAAINDMEFVSHPHISPDGGYMLFDSPEPGGQGNADLYISFHENGKWQKPVNLGSNINSPSWEGMALVSPDEKYIFFCRAQEGAGDTHWAVFDKERYR